MQIRCESCRRSYDFDANDGLCPRCGCYNNISDAAALRLEAQREARWEAARARRTGSLCDAQDASGRVSRYDPDCMEDSHDPAHAHTGGVHLQSERLLPPLPKVPPALSRTPVRDSYARKVHGLEPAGKKVSAESREKPKKSGLGIVISILIALLTLLSNLLAD